MNDFWQRFDKELKNNSKTYTFMCNELHITNAVMSNWKSRGVFPAADIALKMADLLGVSLEYLLYGTEPDSEKAELKAEVRQLKECLTQALAKLEVIETKL
jgi:transcriptional regulator with XRE-family HTH domain